MHPLGNMYLFNYYLCLAGRELAYRFIAIDRARLTELDMSNFLLTDNEQNYSKVIN